MSKQTRRRPDVHSITDAREAHTTEMHSRMVKYAVSMGIRFVCLVLIFFVEGWMVWVLIAGAVFLPYFAVIIANAGSDNTRMGHSDALLDHAPAAELEAGPADSGGPAEAAGSTVLQGEVVDPGDADSTGSPDQTIVPPEGGPAAPKNEAPPTA